MNNVTGAINETLILNGPGPINDGALLNVAGNNTWAGSVDPRQRRHHRLQRRHPDDRRRRQRPRRRPQPDQGGRRHVVFATNNTYRGETFINNGPLVIETPLGLGTGTLNSSANDTIVNDAPKINQFGQLQLLDPTGVGFTVLNEQLTLNGFGPDDNGALYNVQGNNDWAGNIILQQPFAPTASRRPSAPPPTPT